MPPITPFISSFSGLIIQTSASMAALGTVTASAVKDFFLNVFLHPGDNFIAVVVVGGTIAAAGVGIAFLVQLVFNKYCANPNK